MAADDAFPGINHLPRLIDAHEEVPDPSRMVSTAETLLAATSGTASPLIAAEAAAYGFRTLVVAAAAAVETPASFNRLCDETLEVARSGRSEGWSRSLFSVHLAVAEAYQAQALRQPAMAQWRRALDLAGRFGRFTALRPRLELARACLEHDEREAGKELLTSVWQDARAMNALWFEQQAVLASRRFRVHLAERDDALGPLARLTPREREVLDLVSAGATNRAIASALFITEKTASVHVSHVLMKLGVSTRGQAAAMARDAGRPARIGPAG